MGNPSWNEIFKGRKQASLPNILKLPMVRSRMEVLKEVIRNGSSVLDVGANDRTQKELNERAGIKAEYFSLDVDRTLRHDYYDYESIDRSFDVITAFELVEHMTVQQIIEFLSESARILKKGGRIVVSTPNVCHPVHFWRDCTHITPVRHNELYGLLHSAGFEDIKIYRSGKIKLKYRLLALYYRPLFKLLNIDFMPSIIAVGTRK